MARTPDPAARANFEQMLAAQPSLMDEISAGARSFGFDPHNVVDAYVMWWMNVWLVANKRDEVPDRGTIAAVKQQVHIAFSSTPDLAKADDAARQEYGEALLLQAAMLGSAFEQWKNDPKMLQQLADAAHKGAQASGLNLSLMTLTQEGFVPRKRAEAGGVVDEGKSAVRRARAEPVPDVQAGGSWRGTGVAASVIGLAVLGGAALLLKG